MGGYVDVGVGVDVGLAAYKVYDYPAIAPLRRPVLQMSLDHGSFILCKV